MKPTRDLVAFKWIKPSYSNLIIPDSAFKIKDSRVGQYYLGDVVAVGPDVKNIKKSDKILVHEYGVLNRYEDWNENDIYFISEKEIPATVSKKFTGIIERIFSSKKREHILAS